MPTPQTQLTRERIRQGNRALQLQNMIMQGIRGWDFQYHAASDFQDHVDELDAPSAGQVIMAGTAALIVLLAVLALVGVVVGAMA